MSTVQRNLYLKRVRFKSGRNKGFTPTPLEKLMKTIRAKTSSWTERHWPNPPAKGQPPFQAGTRCLYITRIGERTVGKADGIYFEVGSYVYGKGENQIAVDLSGDEPDVQSGPIVDKKGKQRSILHMYRCVVLGECMIVHKQRGAGGLPDLGNLMTSLFRAHVDPAMPSIEFLDVLGPDVRDLIEQGGGVESIEISLIDTGAKSEDKAFAKPLFDAKKFISGKGRFKAEWEANGEDELDADDVINAYQAIDGLGKGFGSVSIKTYHGGWIRNLGKYEAHDEITVTIDRLGMEHVGEIRAGLFDYLDKLRKPKGKKSWRIIRDDGSFNHGSKTVLMKK